jgi:hypothetical protein
MKSLPNGYRKNAFGEIFRVENGRDYGLTLQDILLIAKWLKNSEVKGQSPVNA